MSDIPYTPPAPPTADEFFGKPSADKAGLPTAAQFFGKPPIDVSALPLDDHDFGAAWAPTLEAFGHSIKANWGEAPLGLNEQQTADLKNIGIFPDYQQGRATLAQEFNKVLIGGVAQALDIGLNRIPSVVHGMAIDIPGLGPLAAGMEAFPLAHFTGLPARILPTPASLMRGAELGIIGNGEAGWKGTLPEAAEAARRLEPTGTETPTERTLRPGSYLDVDEAAPADVHQLARRIAPEIFAEYDARAADKAAARQRLDELRQAQEQPLHDQMEALMERVHGREIDMTTAQQRRYNSLYFELQDLRDTPEMASLRRELMAADETMRDLAPQVSVAYRDAGGRMPDQAAPPESPVEAAVAPEAAPGAETAAIPEPAAPAAPAQAALPIPPAGIAEIAGDVARQLRAAGRPSDEANAAAAVIAAHYEARAARFDGALGTPFELYQAEGADIRGRASGGPGGIAAGRSTLREARTIITLFQKADASTFIHETGHQWLGELLRDAADERAPQELKGDADTVRNWLGAGAGEPTRRQHEMFARGFEAYMMEGRAPSPALAGVFGQFRAWLLAIYDRIKGQSLPVIDSVRGVFDRLVGAPEIAGGRVTLAPERELPPTGEEGQAARAAELGIRPTNDAADAALAEAAAAEPAQPAAPTTRSRNPESAYVAVPAEPVRLAQFLKAAGGLKDEAGELRAIEAHKRPGLVNRAGRSLDDAREQAEEAGYLPQGSTIADLIAALDEDLRGTPRYSREDAAAAELFRQAVEKNSEVDRLAQQLGIDPRDWTRAQFWNMAAEHLAGERLEAEQRSLDAAHQAEFDEAERKAKAWAESRGEAWEPEDAAGRTQEDLEREDQSRETGGAALAQPGGARGAGAAVGGEGALQGRGGQGGSAVGAGRGAAAPGRPTEPPGSAGGRFQSDQRLVDKAGNIRLDNLNQPDDVDAAIRAAAARHGDFLPERRGVLSDGEVLDLAEALGRDPAFLDRKKIGEAFNAEEVMAVRRLLIRSATEVRDRMAAAAAGDETELLTLAQAIARHEMIQGKAAQATAEWGRAGRSFRMLIEGAPEAAQLDAFLRENTGRTLYQIQEMAQRGQSLPTPGQVSKFVADLSQGDKIRRAIIYYWINALISGPITHARYSVGNALNALWTPLVETPIAATIGAARQALDIGSAADRVYLGEAAAQLYGLAKGTRDGWAAATEAFRTGQSPPLPTERIPSQFLEQQIAPIPGIIGQAIGVPGRSVAAIHSFFKSLRYEQNIQALAYRTAMNEGLDGEAFTARLADLTSSPTEVMMTDATKNALKELYMTPTDYHSMMGPVIRATNHPSNMGLIAKIILPFIKIGSQITRNAFIERSPLALTTAETRGNLLSGEARGDLQAAKITAGMGLVAATSLMALEGLATGDGPADPAKRAEWLLNHRPNSITIGNITIPYQGLGHLGMLMRFSANMTETAEGWAKEDDYKIASSFFHGFTHAVLDENFMRGMHDLLDAIYDWDRYGNRYIQSFATNWLPYSVGLGQVARAIDPYSREAHSIFEAARARLPGVSLGLFPRRDMFGEPIGSTTGLPGLPGRYADDPVVKAMDELHMGVARTPKKIRGVTLSEQQFDDFSRLGGRMAKLHLDNLVRPGFERLPAGARIDLMHQTISDARSAASDLVIAQSLGGDNDILKLATKAKVDKLTGVKQ